MLLLMVVLDERAFVPQQIRSTTTSWSGQGWKNDIFTGLGKCSSIFEWFPRVLWLKEQLVREKERIVPVALLSWVTWVNSTWSLVCHEQPEQIAHNRSFEKPNGSKSLKSLFKEELMSKERQEPYALWHKKGENCQIIRKIWIFWENHLFYEAFCLNPKRITHTTLFKSNESDSLTSLFCKEQCEWIAHVYSFVKRDMSESLMVAL